MIPLTNNKYSVTDDGKVYTEHRHRFMKMSKLNSGYLFVRIDGRTQLVHRLVATAYLPNPNNLPCINHKDKNKHNNHATNLEWCTYSENNHHRDNKLSAQERFNSYINRGIEPEVALYSLC